MLANCTVKNQELYGDLHKWKSCGIMEKSFSSNAKLPNLFVHLDRKPLTHMAAVKTVDSGSILAIHIISTLSLESDYNS